MNRTRVILFGQWMWYTTNQLRCSKTVLKFIFIIFYYRCVARRKRHILNVTKGEKRNSSKMVSVRPSSSSSFSSSMLVVVEEIEKSMLNEISDKNKKLEGKRFQSCMKREKKHDKRYPKKVELGKIYNDMWLRKWYFVSCFHFCNDFIR